MADLDVSHLNVSVDVGQLPKVLEAMIGAIKDSASKIAALEAALAEARSAKENSKPEPSPLDSALRDSVESQTKSLSELQEKLNTFERLDITGALDKVATFESKLADLAERVGQFEVSFKTIEKTQADQRLLLDQADKKAQDATDQLRKIIVDEKQTVDLAIKLNARTEAVETEVAALAKIVTSAEEVLASRYEQIRVELTDSLTRVANDQAQFLARQDAERLPHQDYLAKTNEMVQSLVGSAQRTIASAKFDVARRKAAENMLQAWLHQSGLAVKRRLAVRALTKIFCRKQRESVEKWKWQTKLDSVVAGFQEEINARLPSDPAMILAGSGIAERLVALESDLTATRAEMATTIALEESKNKLIEEFKLMIQSANETLHAAGADSSADYEAKLKLCIETMEEFKSSVIEARDSAGLGLRRMDAGEFASAHDLQKIMTDVLLLWNSMKQLDACKAEKREFEQFALEASNRQPSPSVVSPAAPAVSAAVAAPQTSAAPPAAPPAAAAAPEILEGFSRELSLQSQRIDNLHSFFTSLAEFVEELVLRISTLRGFEGAQLPVFPAALLRVGGGYRPLEAADVEINESANTDSMDRFLRYARSLVSNAAEYSGERRSPPRAVSRGRRELILPADLRLDGATYVPRQQRRN